MKLHLARAARFERGGRLWLAVSVFVSVLVASLAFVTGVSAQETEPPFSFEAKVQIVEPVDKDGELVDKNRETFEKKVTYSIRNESSSSITVDIALDPPTDSQEGKSFTLLPGATGNGSAKFSNVGVDEAVTVTATLQGNAAVGYAEGFVAQANGTGKAAPMPQISTWSDTSYFGWPGWGSGGNPQIPLASDAACAAINFPEGKPPEDAVVGWIVAGADTVKVTAECAQNGSAPVYASLSFDDLGGIWDAGREYTGSIDLAPGNDKEGSIDITVVRSHAPWMALLALAGALTGATWLTYQKASSGRVVLAVKGYLYGLIAKARGHDESDGPYQIGNGVQAKVALIIMELEQLAALHPKANGLKNSKEYKSIRDDQIYRLHDLVEGWEASGLGSGTGQLAELTTWWESSSGAVDASLTALADYVRKSFIDVQQKELTYEAAVALRQETAKAAAFAAKWEESKQLIDQSASMYDNLNRLSHDDEGFTTAKAEAVRAWVTAREQLGAASSPSEAIELLRDKGSVADARIKLQHALRRHRDLERTLVAHMALEAASPVSEAPRFSVDLTTAADARSLAKKVRAKRRRLDFLLLVATGVGALLSGMLVIYVGEPFGTGWDYAEIVVWGLVGGVLIAGVDEALRRLRVSSTSIIG